MPGGMGYFEKPKIKNVVLLKHEEGEGPKIQFEAPNKITFSHGNCQSNFKVVVKDQGKVRLPSYFFLFFPFYLFSFGHIDQPINR